MIDSIDAIIVSKKEIATHTTEIALQLQSKDVAFVAGQYMTVTLPTLAQLEPRARWRDFSISSAPFELPIVKTAYRTSNSPFKTELAKLPIGSTIQVALPKGFFTLPEDPNKKIACIAGGIGITPFMSMLLQEKHIAGTRNIALYYFNKNRESTAYHEEIRALCDGMAHFFYDPDDVTAVPTDDMYDTNWYIAGPEGMVIATSEHLRKNGVTSEQLFTEQFTGYSS